MTEQEEVEFLARKLKELNEITSQIEEVFPEKSFKLDGKIKICFTRMFWKKTLAL